MNRSLLFIAVFLTCSVYGQTKMDTVTIFKNISLEFCNCALSKNTNNRFSYMYDSCRQLVVGKYADSLKKMGFDQKTEAGFWKLYREVDEKLYSNCPGLASLAETKHQRDTLLFSGQMLSQRKLTSGVFEIVMEDIVSKEIKIFYKKTPLDESRIAMFEPGYVITIEYEIVKNQSTNKDEFYFTEFGGFSIMGMEKKQK